MTKHYINAVVALLLEGRDLDVVLKNLSTLLAQKGHTRLHAAILAGVCVQLEERQKQQTPSVLVSKEADAKKLAADIKKAQETLGATSSDFQVLVDPNIIGGFIATFNSKRINASYKEKLVSLYRNITA